MSTVIHEQTGGTVTNHNQVTNTAVGFVRDSARKPNPRHLELDASVKSGEYFLTLATLLDHVCTSPEAQQLIRDLIYLQRHYKIVRR